MNNTPMRGNRTRAAKVVRAVVAEFGVSRQALYKRIKQMEQQDREKETVSEQ